MSAATTAESAVGPDEVPISWVVMFFCDLPGERCAVAHLDGRWIVSGPDTTREGQASDADSAMRAALGDMAGARWGRMALASLSRELEIVALECADGRVQWQIWARSGVADYGSAESLEAAQAAAEKAFRAQVVVVPSDLLRPPRSRELRRKQRRPRRRGRR